jgi:hypothetical protein
MRGPAPESEDATDGPAEWVSQVNHRQGQFWDGGPRPMDAPPPERAAPSGSTLFERKDDPRPPRAKPSASDA